MNIETAKEDLASKDAILENPKNLINNIKTLENEGLIEDAKSILKNSYIGTLEVLVELWNWLSLLYDDPDSITSLVQEIVKKNIIQNYDRQKLLPMANNSATVAETLKWVYELIESPIWRQSIYELTEQPQNDGCPFLSMSMTCMAFNDKYLVELARVPKSWSEMSTLMRCARYLLEPLLSMSTEMLSIDRDSFLRMKDEMKGMEDMDPNGPEFHNNSRAVLFYYLNGFLDMGCHSEHTYLIIQSLLQCLDRSTQYHLPQHLSRLLEQEATSRCKEAASKYSVYFRNTRDYPDAMKAMNQILIENKLIVEEIEFLYNLYNSNVPPPVDLLRINLFIDMLCDSLFVSKETLLQEHSDHLSYLLSYASSVEEFYSDDNRVHWNKSKVNQVKENIDKSSKICRQWANTSSSGLSIRSYRDLPILLDLLSCAPVAYAVFRFLNQAFREKRIDFELNMEALKPYTILVNELSTNHTSLHSKNLRFLVSLLESDTGTMEALREMEYKKCIVDMLLHLLIEGHGVHVISAISRLFFKPGNNKTADISLVRYFVVELLDLCQPPYSLDFMNSLEPLVSNSDIQSGLHSGKEVDAVNEFLDHCRNNMISSVQIH